MTSARLILLSANYKGQEFELTRDSYSCGRMHDQDICIPDITVSSHHCDFVRTSDGNSYIIRDNHSTNGTRVNGVPVTNEEVELAHADIVVIGMVEAMFECQSARKNVPQAKFSSTTKIDLGSDNMQKTIPVLPTAAAVPAQQSQNATQKLFILIIALLVLVAAIVLVFAALKISEMKNMPPEPPPTQSEQPAVPPAN